jgi:hypothetical protein
MQLRRGSVDASNHFAGSEHIRPIIGLVGSIWQLEYNTGHNLDYGSVNKPNDSAFRAQGASNRNLRTGDPV